MSQIYSREGTQLPTATVLSIGRQMRSMHFGFDVHPEFSAEPCAECAWKGILTLVDGEDQKGITVDDRPGMVALEPASIPSGGITANNGCCARQEMPANPMRGALRGGPF